ncbi:unnamed protein product [Cylicocyclus nassatus]|uniref:Uncharacterized protein n=1 Tax=Cylicocyclus nassatus TaxID=53992 RepID=A0AA36MF17_CYLNA|nr:unnamed protein product [Cylicocyclus nassatus]
MCANVQTNSDTTVTQVCYEDMAMAESSAKTEDSWASPSQEPVNGIVQPRVVPPFGKPTRHTNQLDYLLKTVLKAVMKHKHAWPFVTPVDAVKLNLPDYHKVVRRPMDLKTIEMRLRNTYYYSAKDCMEDIECVFRNCYKFNQMEDDVAIMCQNIENVYRNLIQNLPEEDPERKSLCPAREPQLRRHSRSNYENSESESMKFCREVLEELMGNECKDFNWPFLAPVDVKGLHLLDYYDIVSKPMDLGTIKKKLESKQYANAEEFAEDIRLVCNNCFKYNPSSHIVHQHARALLQAFNERWLNLPVGKKNVHFVASSSRTAVESIKSCRRVELLEEKLSTITGDIASHLMRIKELVGQTAPQDVIFKEIELVEELLNQLSSLSVPQYEPVDTKAHKASTATSIVKDLVSSSPEPKTTHQTSVDADAETAQPCCSYGLQRTAYDIHTNKKHRKKDYRFDSGDEAAHKPMSFDEKRQLSLDMGKLPADKLTIVVSIIENREGLSDDKAEEVEIDFEALKPVTLHELRAFVTAILKRKSRKTAKVGNEERKRAIEEKIKNLGGSITQRPKKGAPSVDTVALQASKCAPSLSEISSDSEDSSSSSNASSDSD